MNGLLPLLKVLAAIASVCWMIYAGFIRKPGLITSWSMFCRGTFVLVSVTYTDESGKTVDHNLYHHLFPGSFMMSPHKLQDILDMSLGDRREAYGSGIVLSRHGITRLEVKNGRVVA